MLTKSAWQQITKEMHQIKRKSEKSNANEV